MNSKPGFLILAAGWARRFGSNKLQARLASGNAVLWQSCKNVQELGEQSLLVVNAEVPFRPDADLEKLQLDVLKIKSHSLGESIAGGVKYTSAWNGWVLCLADMPFISMQTLGKMTDMVCRYPDNIIRTRHKGKLGHPVYFPPRFYQELTALRADEGARSLIAKYAPQLICLDVDDAGVLYDIDYPLDLLGP